MIKSYFLPTTCDCCVTLLAGLARQGLQCQNCGTNVHEKCRDNFTGDCVKGATCSVMYDATNASATTANSGATSPPQTVQTVQQQQQQQQQQQSRVDQLARNVQNNCTLRRNDCEPLWGYFLHFVAFSVTRKKSPNVYKSCLKMISLEN